MLEKDSQTQFSCLPLFSVTSLTITQINVMHFNGLWSEDRKKRTQRNVDMRKKQNQDNVLDEVRKYQQN
jgi:hypothetical protein